MSIVYESTAPGRPPLGPDERPKLEALRATLQDLKAQPGSTLEALYAAQALFTYVPPEAIELIAEELGQPESHVYGVVTFYTMFYLEPQPTYILRVCRDLSCHLAGAPKAIAAFSNELGVHRGEITPDRKFKLELVSCLGLCDKQPAMLVNMEPHGPMTPDRVTQLTRELRERKA